MDWLQERIKLLTRSPLWAIHPAMLATMVLHLVTRPESTKEESARWEAARPSMIGKGNAKMSVIPVEGVLTKDGPAWYGSNYETISNAVEQAGADPAVKRVVLMVDSPGGEVTGLPETAALIAQVAKVKPVSAIVTGMSASAAYYLTSQANDVSLTPSGEVGSVGVRLMHMDISKMLEQFGVSVTEMQSGKFKTEWSPYKPLSEDAQAEMQPRLEAAHQQFIDAVTTGRGLRATQEAKDARFGEGRMFDAPEALRLGLVDRVQPARDAMRLIMPVAEQEDSATPTFPVGPRRARLELERAKS